MKLAGASALVTGGTGFLGSHLVRRLVGADARVAVVARTASDPWRVADVLDRIQRIDGDVTDARALREAVRQAAPVAVFHLAAWTGGRHSDAEDAFRRSLAVNHEGTMNVLKAVRDEAPQARIVRTGSMAEYGDGPAPFREDAPTREDSPYSGSQILATHLAHAIAPTWGVTPVTLRPSLVYGPAQDPDYFLPGLIRACLAGRDFPMTTGEQAVDFVFVEDVVDALLLAAETEAAGGEILNVGSGREITIRALAERVVERIGTQGKLLLGAVPTRQAEARHRYLDIAKAERVLGWAPGTSLDEGLDRTIAWHRAQAG